MCVCVCVCVLVDCPNENTMAFAESANCENEAIAAPVFTGYRFNNAPNRGLARALVVFHEFVLFSLLGEQQGENVEFGHRVQIESFHRVFPLSE